MLLLLISNRFPNLVSLNIFVVESGAKGRYSFSFGNGKKEFI